MSKLDELLRIYKPVFTTHEARMTEGQYEIMKQAIKALYLELIGEDEKDYDEDRFIGRNQIRAELRQKVEEL